MFTEEDIRRWRKADHPEWFPGPEHDEETSESRYAYRREVWSYWFPPPKGDL